MSTMTPTSAPGIPAHGSRMTLAEFLALGEDVRAELVDGILLYKGIHSDVSPARRPHGSIAARLVRALGNYADAHALGEVFDSSTEFMLRRDPPLVLVPDVSFVRRARLPEDLVNDDAEYAVLAPDLAAEVLSPSERAGRVQQKIEEYLEHGTDLVWLIDPQHRTATVYTRQGGVRWLHEGDRLDGGDVIPGFSVPLAFLFAGLAPQR